MDFWEVIWSIVSIFFFFAYLMILWTIFSDLFMDDSTSGIMKALWIVALIFIPLLASLAYVIFRGKGMQQRKIEQVRGMQAAQEQYIKSVAGGGTAKSPAEQIADAKSLLDSGAISQAEFDTLKAKALA